MGTLIEMRVIASRVSQPCALDGRGRIMIGREFRDRLGGRIVQILTPHGVLLRPVPDELEGSADQEAELPETLSASGEQDAWEISTAPRS